MQKLFYLYTFIIISLCSNSYAADTGTAGRDYDTLVVVSDSDEDVHVVATVKTISTLPNSSATISVTDNGEAAFGPATTGAPSLTQHFVIRGKGRHELRANCDHFNATPVYCTLDASSGIVASSK